MRALTTEEFIEKACNRYGDRYDYSKTMYTTAKVKVDIHCKAHNTWFKQGAFDHLKGVGCPSCVYEARGVHRRKTTEDFVRRSRGIHENRYDYSKTDYKYSHTKVTITCPKHGDFKQLPTNHLKGYGCDKCAAEFTSEKNRSNTEEFIVKARKIHGDKYAYSSVEYEKAIEKVNIICPVHGVFQKTPNEHLNGSGCGECTPRGYQLTLPGHLYVLQCDNLTKVGITNREVSDRVAEISQSYGKEFLVKYTYRNEDGRIAKDLESSCLSILRKTYQNPGIIFDGYTECFLDVNVDMLLDEIRYLSYELTQ